MLLNEFILQLDPVTECDILIFELPIISNSNTEISLCFSVINCQLYWTHLLLTFCHLHGFSFFWLKINSVYFGLYWYRSGHQTAVFHPTLILFGDKVRARHPLTFHHVDYVLIFIHGNYYCSCWPRYFEPLLLKLFLFFTESSKYWSSVHSLRVLWAAHLLLGKLSCKDKLPHLNAGMLFNCQITYVQ